MLKRIACLTRDFLTCALPLQYISLPVGTAMGDTIMATTIKVMAAATDIVKDTVKDIAKDTIKDIGMVDEAHRTL